MNPQSIRRLSRSYRTHKPLIRYSSIGSHYEGINEGLFIDKTALYCEKSNLPARLAKAARRSGPVDRRKKAIIHDRLLYIFYNTYFYNSYFKSNCPSRIILYGKQAFLLFVFLLITNSLSYSFSFLHFPEFGYS